MNCIVAQSGGPTSAINATLAGVIKGALKNNFENIYGSRNGIEGILKDNIVSLNPFKDEEKFNLLVQTPAAFLGSCRYKLPDFNENEEPYINIITTLKKYDIGYFFYIGGNDSMDTVKKLSGYVKEKGIDIKVMGIPKTIDNDLPCTDHTPGFGSAAKYIATTVREIAIDCEVYDTKSVTIIEIMGRSAGWLTASSALARSEYCSAPHLIYLPEKDFDADQFLADINKTFEKHKNVIVCVSEGIKEKNGAYVCESFSSGLTDVFGHKYLSGTAKALEDLVRNKLGCKVRGIELSLCQRCSSHIASKTDLDESIKIGMAGVDYAVSGGTGKMMAYKRVSDNPYKIEIEAFDISLAANLEKTVPDNMINKDANDVTEDLITYAKPLIEGEHPVIFKDSLPANIRIEEILWILQEQNPIL